LTRITRINADSKSDTLKVKAFGHGLHEYGFIEKLKMESRLGANKPTTRGRMERTGKSQSSSPAKARIRWRMPVEIHMPEASSLSTSGAIWGANPSFLASSSTRKVPQTGNPADCPIVGPMRRRATPCVAGSPKPGPAQIARPGRGPVPAIPTASVAARPPGSMNTQAGLARRSLVAGPPRVLEQRHGVSRHPKTNAAANQSRQPDEGKAMATCRKQLQA